MNTVSRYPKVSHKISDLGVRILNNNSRCELLVECREQRNQDLRARVHFLPEMQGSDLRLNTKKFDREFKWLPEGIAALSQKPE